jgi:hypothetical protein
MKNKILRIFGVIGFILALGSLSACFDDSYPNRGYPAYSYGSPTYAYPGYYPQYAPGPNYYAYNHPRWRYHHDREEQEEHEHEHHHHDDDD